MISVTDFRQTISRGLNEAIIKGYRPGQYVSNCLKDFRPDIADAIINTEADPFYNDANLQPFWKKVEELW